MKALMLPVSQLKPKSMRGKLAKTADIRREDKREIDLVAAKTSTKRVACSRGLNGDLRKFR